MFDEHATKSSCFLPSTYFCWTRATSVLEVPVHAPAGDGPVLLLPAIVLVVPEVGEVVPQLLDEELHPNRPQDPGVLEASRQDTVFLQVLGDREPAVLGETELPHGVVLL